jgi:hypothetical protein
MRSGVVANAGRDQGVAGAAGAIVLRGRERAAKPGGISDNRNAAAAHSAAAGTKHSSRAAGKACRENLADGGLGAGPRAAAPAAAVQPPVAAVLPPTAAVLPPPTASSLLRLPGRLGLRCTATVLPKGRSVAAGTVPGSGGIAADDTPFPGRWPGTPGTTSNAASVWLPFGRRGCNSVAGVDMDGTRVHISSVNRAALDSGDGPVAWAATQWDTEVGPRELSTRWVKSRRRGATRLRGVFIDTSSPA